MPQTSPIDRAYSDGVREALRAIRAFSDAMDRMHGDIKGDMAMNATDLAALRMLVMREQRGESVSPHQLASHLRISTASTTKMLDRLTATGHVQRLPHPHDGRARVVVLTDESRRAFFEHFGQRLIGLRDIAERYSEDELAVVSRFLDEVNTVLDPHSEGAS